MVGSIDYPEELKPIQRLIEFADRACSWTWTFEGDVVVTYGDDELRCHARGDWNTTSVEIECPRYESMRFQQDGSYGILVEKADSPRLVAVDGSWSSDDVWFGGARPSEDPDSERTTVHLYSLAVGNPDAATSSHGLVIGGAALGVYPWSVQRDGDAPGLTINGVVTTLFGRPAILRDIRSAESVSDLLVLYEGMPFSEIEQTAIWLTLTFLGGSAGAVTATIAIEGDVELGRRVYAWQRPAMRAQPPILLSMLHPTKIGEYVSAMCDAARSLLEDNERHVHLDVALQHLFANSHGSADIEMRDLTLALDSLIESSAEVQKKATAIPAAAYKKLRPRLEEAIHAVLAAEGYADSKLQTRLFERLRGGNDMSLTARREAFWSRVGITLKSDETDALSNRHAMAHAGMLLRRAGDEKLQKLIFQIQIVRTLVNRVILSLLGYRGPVLNYLIGRNSSWEHFERRLSSDFGTFGSE